MASWRQTINGLLHKAQGTVARPGTGNAPVLLTLGGFKFALNSAAPQEITRDTAFGWAWQDRIGRPAAGQYVGPGADTITLPGVIAPDFRGGIGQVATLRSMAAEGKPHRLITGTGDVLGLWAIEGVTEGQTHFKPDGTFRRQEFSITLRRWGDDADL